MLLLIIDLIVLWSVISETMYRTVWLSLAKRLYRLLAYNRISSGQFRVLINELEEARSIIQIKTIYRTIQNLEEG